MFLPISISALYLCPENFGTGEGATSLLHWLKIWVGSMMPITLWQMRRFVESSFQGYAVKYSTMTMLQPDSSPAFIRRERNMCFQRLWSLHIKIHYLGNINEMLRKMVRSLFFLRNI